MRKIKSLLFRALPNAAHFSYCVEVSRALSMSGEAVLAALGELPARFDAWLDKEWALMYWVRKSVITGQIAAAVGRMERALVWLNMQVRAQEYSLTPAVAESARRLHLMLKNYGKVYDKPYDEKEGDVKVIVDLLLNTYPADVALLGLAAGVAELQEAFAEFQSLVELRYAQVAKKPAETFKMVRRGLEAEYHKIVEKVNAGAALNADPGFAALVDKLNPEIEHRNVEFHRTRKSIGAGSYCMVEAIDAQPHTGEAVTPIPKAYYREEDKEAVGLVFAKDFSVTYRNNVNAGTASLTLHGKGAYKGRKTVTFYIDELRTKN